MADDHARLAANEARRAIAKATHTGRFLSPALRMTLFLNTIGSKLLYGVEAWWRHTSAPNKEKLSSAWAALARLFIGAHKTANGDSCTAEAGMRPPPVWVSLLTQTFEGKLRSIDPAGPHGFLSKATAPPPAT